MLENRLDESPADSPPAMGWGDIQMPQCRPTIPALMSEGNEADDAAAIIGDQGVFAFMPLAKFGLEGELLSGASGKYGVE